MDIIITNIKDAEEMLINSTQNSNINCMIYNEICKWEIDKNAVFDDIKRKTEELFNNFIHPSLITVDDNNELILPDKDSNFLALQCYIGEELFQYIQSQFDEEDSSFFRKCQALNNRDISVEQLGGNENYAIQLSAAIVELSMLDTHETPMEKMSCLCTTYDLIFAELKSALISIISKYSDKDNEIPVINNDDLVPILMIVIIKSKLTHLFSSLFYMKTFYYKLEENRNICNIFTIYETAVNNIKSLKRNSLQPSNSSKISSSLDLCDFIKLTSAESQISGEENQKTVLTEEKERILKLITTSTDKK